MISQVEFPCDKKLTELYNNKLKIYKKYGTSSIVYKNAHTKYKKEYKQYWRKFSLWCDKV